MAAKKVYKMTVEQSTSTMNGSIIRCAIVSPHKPATPGTPPPIRLASAVITIQDPDNALAAGYKFGQQITVTIE